MTIFIELALAAMVAIFVWIFYTLVNDKRNAVKHYWSHIYAYKVGLIKKRAKESEVELCFPTAEDEFITKIEGRVEEHISTAGNE